MGHAAELEVVGEKMLLDEIGINNGS